MNVSLLSNENLSVNYYKRDSSQNTKYAINLSDLNVKTANLALILHTYKSTNILMFDNII